MICTHWWLATAAPCICGNNLRHMSLTLWDSASRTFA